MTRQTVIVGTAGHIDHGKTTLLRALTGIDADRLPEEKQRGMTIDIGFAHLELGALRIGFIDVPGHERFVKNMLAGAVGMDLALLVIAADDSVMPQTREHLAILQLLGIGQGVIALTKCDRVEEGWLEAVEEDVRELVQGTFLESAPIVRTSVPAGGSPQGLKQLCQAIALACEHMAPRRESRLFRMPIDRAFSLQGVGAVVTGTVWSGQVSPRDEVEWMPGRRRVSIRGVQSHGQDALQVSAGQRAALNLVGARHHEIRRGDELATPGLLWPSKLLTVEMQVLKESHWPIKHRSRQRMHIGTQEVGVTVALLEGSVIAPGGRGVAQLYCDSPTVCVARQPFVIRAESPVATLGGGVVLQPCAGKIKRRQRERIARLALLSSVDDATRAATAVYFFGGRKWGDLDLCREADLDPDRCPAVVQALRQTGVLVPLGIRSEEAPLVHVDWLRQTEDQLVGVLEHLHSEAPLRPLVPRERLVQACGGWLEGALVHAVLEHMLAVGRLQGDLLGVALRGFAPQLSPSQQSLRHKVLDLLRAGGVSPPDFADLCRATAASPDVIRQLLDLAVFEGKAVRIREDLYLDAQVEAALRRRVTDEIRRSRGLTVSQIRDLLGTTRKFAVPICEHLDRIGLTRRHDDLRVLR